jgi:transposase InsO family protein
MLSHDIPSQPWEIVHSDYFELDGHKYLLIVDQYSKMPFVRAVRDETAKEAIKFCKDMFAIHGIPRLFNSNNGPQYSSAEFRNFAFEWDKLIIT